MAKPTEVPKGPQPVAPPPVSNPDGIRAVYSNFMGVSVTVTDVEIVFTQVGQNTGATGESSLENRIVAKVKIPISQVQPLIQVLTTSVAHHTERAKEFLKQLQKQQLSTTKH